MYITWIIFSSSTLALSLHPQPHGMKNNVEGVYSTPCLEISAKYERKKRKLMSYDIWKNYIYFYNYFALHE
jgi:hypothetical protein